MASVSPFFLKEGHMFRKKKEFVEYHKYKVVKEKKVVRKEEIYPETHQKLIRPKINYLNVCLKIAVSLFVNLLLVMLVFDLVNKTKPITHEWIWRILTFIFLQIITIIINLKRIVIFIIRLYQRYAPYEVRSTCLFVPNCSEYMVLAIEKYGLIKGIKMGLARFNRCKPPYGGVDYP